MLARHLRQVQAIRRRAVEAGRPHLRHPGGGAQRLPGHAGAEREDGGPQSLGADQGAPAAHVEAEEGADEDAVRRPYAHAPKHPRMRVGDRPPVAAADAEGGGPARGTRGAVHVVHLARLHAQVVAVGLGAHLRVTQLGLGDHRYPLEILQAAHAVRMHAGLGPLTPVERRALPGIAHDLADPLKDAVLALGGVHGLADREPVRRAGRRPVRVVVARGPAPALHQRRGRTAWRTASTTS